MAWINCYNLGTSWINVWHLSKNNANIPRNPALYIHADSAKLYPCHTSEDGSDGDVSYYSSTGITYGVW